MTKRRAAWVGVAAVGMPLRGPGGSGVAPRAPLFTPPLIALCVVWCVLSVASWWFYGLYRNARVKRALHPWLNVLGGVLMVVIAVVAGAPWPLLIPWSLFVSLIFLHLIYGTRFCDRCGATVRPKRGIFWRPVSCSRCGAPLDGQVVTQ
jgi:hypothetical protein